MGFREQASLRPEIKSLIDELLAGAKNDFLLEPAIAYGIYPLTEMNRGRLPLEDNGVIHDPLLPSLLSGADEFAVVICTIGHRLEKQVTNYFKQDEPLRGVLLDGIGSAAVDLLAEEACKLMTERASSRGYQAGSPISPGMQGLPITEQRWLFKMAPAQKIGVGLTSSGVMSPLKSTSMIIGIGPQMKTWTRAEVCAQCGLRKTCPYRKGVKGEKQKRGKISKKSPIVHPC
ncbi:MAG: hypothetical protein FJ130_01265 [Deltaproteobacteria bacterium]|nr:hypothetical protein [Deltaproteobacteria bacterium]